MDDPWNAVDEKAAPLSPANGFATSEGNNLNFCDNFCPDPCQQSLSLVGWPTSSNSFQPLSDSSQYLANLEKKLSKIQCKTSKNNSREKQDLIYSLAGARDGHIDRFVNSTDQSNCITDNFDDPVGETLFTGSVIRHVAPHLQAVTAGELIHLVKADELDKEEIEESIENNLH